MLKGRRKGGGTRIYRSTRGRRGLLLILAGGKRGDARIFDLIEGGMRARREKGRRNNLPSLSYSSLKKGPSSIFLFWKAPTLEKKGLKIKGGKRKKRRKRVVYDVEGRPGHRKKEEE